MKVAEANERVLTAAEKLPPEELRQNVQISHESIPLTGTLNFPDHAI
jgi:hypothetical protein